MHPRWFVQVLVAVLPLVGGACGSSGSSPGDGGGADAASTSLKAPLIDVIKPASGSPGMFGVHVGWTNNTPDCDGIEGERKDGLHSYAVAFTVAGNATSTDDFTATLDQNYTYRLRCKKGGAYSPYSNEESANPRHP